MFQQATASELLTSWKLSGTEFPPTPALSPGERERVRLTAIRSERAADFPRLVDALRRSQEVWAWFLSGRQGRGWARCVFRWLAPGLVLSSLCACQTIGTIRPVNLAEPGWRVREGQAVWQMPGKRPELAGELTLAANVDGRCFLEFTKGPFPLVRAECGDSRWEIEFPPQKLFFAGGGMPPKRLAWLQVCRGLAGKEARAPWRFARRADGSWRLDNAHGKETVEGYLQP